MDASNDNEPLVLDDACQDAWQAYADMFDSKQCHIDFLEVLENKQKKFNLSPTEQDKEKLAQYLTQHDSQVKRFTQLAQELKATSPESHLLLFKFIAQLGDGEPNKKTQH